MTNIVVVEQVGSETITQVLSDEPTQTVIVEVNHGPKGDKGDSAFNPAEFIQDTPLDLWTVLHNRNDYPNVTIMLQSGERVEADVAYLDRNTLTISFALPTAGKARLI